MDMNTPTLFQQKLREIFEEARLKNPAYSLRAFARKTKVPSGPLSAILSGQRQVSAQFAARVLDRLDISPVERERILSSFPARRRNKPAQTVISRESLRLEADQYALIAQWYHFGILSLIKTEGFQEDPAWIASRLGIRTTDVTTALERLQRVGLLHRDASQKLARSPANIETPDNIVNLAVRGAQSRNLELARESLERDSIDERDFTALTLAFDPKRMTEVKQKIRRFQDELSDSLDQGAKHEVYKLCVQFFPVSKKGARS
jgi:uncharacterized protein (TIGR02147 family)